MIEFQIKGAEALREALSRLPQKMEVRILRGAVRAATKPVLEEAKAKAPVRKGALRDSLRISTKSKRGEVRARVIAGDNKKGGVYYATMVEGGTKPHKIRAGKKSLRIGGVFARSADHPGAKARPFMGPAIKNKAEAALDAAAAYIRKRLDKLVK